jgi:hypothetical protein
MAAVRDIWEGIVFVAMHRRVRPIVLAMTVALAGGGIVVVLGKPFAKDVLNAGTAGFPALLTAFGFGAGAGIVLVTVFGPRIIHKDINFSLALLVTGVSLGAAGLVKTIFGGVGWIFVMGFGAGSGYVLGFAHLHEQTSDAVRGRTFAALLSLMRIGLLTSMTIALPLSALFDGLIPGLLSEGSRVVLLLGGGTIFLGGAITLWRVRRVLVDLGQVDRSGPLGTATEAVRSYRKAVAGKDPEPTEEIPSTDEQTGPRS